MEKIKHHYCWLKVTDSVDETVDKGADAGADVRTDDMLAMLLSTVPKPRSSWSGTSILSTPVPVPTQQRPRVDAMSEPPAPMAGRAWAPGPNSTPVPVPAVAHVTSDDNKQTTPPVPTSQRMGDTPWQTTPPVPAEARMSSAGLEHTTPPIPTPAPKVAAMRGAGRGASASMPVAPSIVPGPASTDLMFAGATFAGAWQFERPEEVGASLRMQWQPVLGGHDAALAWRDSPEGRAWCADAKDLLLVSFVAIGEF